MHQPHILIATVGGDDHASVIAAALAIRGVPHKLWYTADHPAYQTQTFQIANGQPETFDIVQGGDRLALESFQTVWMRYLSGPNFGAMRVAAEDEQFVIRQGLAHSMALGRYLSRAHACGRSLWVNDPLAAQTAASKLLQLWEAKQAGLPIPLTLVTNDVPTILAFIARQRADGFATIRKSFSPSVWLEGDVSASNYTTFITENDLEGFSEVLPYTEIYQQAVEKIFEVRTLVFGRTVFSLKIDSLVDDPQAIDWRNLNLPRDRYHHYRLPDSVADRCFAVLDALGLVSGSFDFCVDRLGNHVFLEVNDAGQFLWMSNVLPDLPIVDAFTDFLCAGERQYIWPERALELTLKSVEGSSEFARIHAESGRHLPFLRLDTVYPR